MQVQADTCADPSKAVPVYRDFNDNIGDHFYTTNSSEYSSANGGGYFGEGPRFAVFPTAQASTVQLIRLWNGGVGDHFFTTDTGEASNAAASGGYVREDLAPMFIYPTQVCASVPLYRSYSADKTDHFYSTSATERDGMTGYNFEGIAGYVLAVAAPSSSASSGANATPGGPASNSGSAPCVKSCVLSFHGQTDGGCCRPPTNTNAASYTRIRPLRLLLALTAVFL
ncbi:hypothetical protein B0H19DRAFT_963544 [Mycena capillaripes]|nr:hypothetical protein B0H19DRAFT_963544 [Mycena capillaripes]